MTTISITIDVTKINKAKIVDASYISKDGSKVNKKEYKVELVPLKEPKTIKHGDGWVLKKTHFLAEQKSKEEKASKADTVYVGEGFQFFDTKVSADDIGAPEEINPEDIPF